jgi:hypothetical protein
MRIISVALMELLCAGEARAIADQHYQEFGFLGTWSDNDCKAGPGPSPL